jgi:hypothetical protein
MQLRQFHGLDEDLIGPLPYGPRGCLGAGLSAQNDDRDRRLSAFGQPQQLRRVAVRQIQVENDRFGSKAAKLSLCVLPIGDVANIVALRGKKAADAGSDNGINIDYEDSPLAQSPHLPDWHEGEFEGLVTSSEIDYVWEC